MSEIKKLLIMLLYCFTLSNTVLAGYTPDILDGYEQRSIQMKPDREGEVVCTLVRKPLIENSKKAVLYIHGYNDYFFQSELGDSITSYGYDFYAIDLRKYGRSILPNQTATSCKSIDEYFADIDTALAIIKEEGHNHIVLMGHSTGGLISSLYLNERKGDSEIKSLILNSPFLDMNMSWFMERIAIPVVAFIGKYFPDWVVEKQGFSSYAKSLLVDHKGEWTFNTGWKKPEGYPKTAGWIRAIHQGHKKIKKGLSIICPVLVLSSDKSFPESEIWNEAYKNSDIVLDVNDIQRLGLKLGEKVIRDTIPGGIHDLILSASPQRQTVYKKYKDWLIN
ncbi:alpha/beta hydrolase [Massilibacteroides sp.]|uniref:alpha/beta hydrolase n=1 Tax=Massilibacteroides sp. TaxID=2034766 RepID=UPI00262F7528|nr:alpha/beta hydrolase [Massilibacteroides sp.]